MFWKKLEAETPIALQSGNWDGLKSDTLLLADKNEKIYVGVMYEGFMDGVHFKDFYDAASEYEIVDVVYWSYIPSLF